MASLIKFESFTSHSGLTLPWKFDADALSDQDIDAIVDIAVSCSLVPSQFKKTYGVPRGGVRLAASFDRYADPSSMVDYLIVDDVLTTGRSMKEAYAMLPGSKAGFVILARKQPEPWIDQLFTSYEVR